MKKILFLLLSTVAMYGQVPADATPLENIQITNNQTSTTATKVNVQENDGTINTKPLSELDNYLEFASAVNLPVTGEQGKLYLTKDNNRLYRFNGTFYQELATSTAYLPLSGGALTGALIGTSANFSSDITSSVYKLEAAGVVGWKYSSTGDTTMYNRITGDYIDGIKYYSGSWTGTNVKSHIFYTGISETEAVVVHNDGSVNVHNLSGSGDGNIVAAADGTLKRGAVLGSNAYSSTAYLPLSGGTLSGTLRFTGSEGIITPNALISEINNYAGGVNQFKTSSIKFYTGTHVDRGKITFNTSIDGIDYVRLTLEETGAATFSSTVSATGFFQSSDLRLKNIIRRDGDVVYYTWKDGRDNKQHIGYIAQEVRKTNPDQVQKAENKMLSVNYVEILVEKIRMLEKRIEELEKSK